MGSIFEGKRPKKPTEDDEAKTSKLYEEIGRLKIELEWLKKNLSKSAKCDRRAFVDPGDPNISIRRQCKLLGVSRSSVYYESTSTAKPNSSKHKKLPIKKLLSKAGLDQG